MHTLRIERQNGSGTTTSVIGVRGLDRAEGVAQSLMATDDRVNRITIEDAEGDSVVTMARTDGLPLPTRDQFARRPMGLPAGPIVTTRKKVSV